MLTFLILFTLFSLALLVAIEIGYRVATHSRFHGSATEPEKIAATFVMTLLGLLLAFALNAARSNFTDQATQVLKEANDIRMARVELEKLEPKAQATAQTLLMDYVETRKAYNQALNSASDQLPSLQKGQDILHEIRRISRSEGATTNSNDLRDVLSSLERVDEAAMERNVILMARNDDIVMNLLMLISFLSAFLYGLSHRGLKARQWWAGLLFATVVSATISIISDYDSPRLGIIRVDHEDTLLDQLGYPKSQRS